MKPLNHHFWQLTVVIEERACFQWSHIASGWWKVCQLIDASFDQIAESSSSSSLIHKKWFTKHDNSVTINRPINLSPNAESYWLIISAAAYGYIFARQLRNRLPELLSPSTSELISRTTNTEMLMACWADPPAQAAQAAQQFPLCSCQIPFS